MIISIIACPNGFGHFFRLIDIAQHLSKFYKINLICTKEQKNKINIKKYKNINFLIILKQIIINEKNYDFLNKFYFRDLEKIKEIKNSHLILSDNLINKIYKTKKFLLISNFFWGDVFNKNLKRFKDYKKIEEEFLKFNKIIQNRYFGIENYKAKKIIKINFIGKKIIAHNSATNFKNKIIFFYNKNKKNIPIKIIKKLQNRYTIVSNYSSKKAGIEYYNKEMGLKKFSFIMSRPGLGSITDSVRYNVPIIYYLEDENNNEMIVNISLIKKYRIGLPIFKKTNISNEILKLKILDYNKLFNNLKKFSFNGEKKILEYVKKQIG